VTFCLDRGIPWFVYGGGSNLLVADEGFEGVLIQVANRRFEVEGTRVHAEAGAITALVARKSVEAGLKGFEWAIGVPGTIGGAVFGDAGCYGGEMKDAVVSVEAFRLADRAHVTYTKEECQFGYRESRFKREPHLILQATLELSPSPDPAATKARLEEIVRTRKSPKRCHNRTRRPRQDYNGRRDAAPNSHCQRWWGKFSYGLNGLRARAWYYHSRKECIVSLQRYQD
jgi:UDP-N-acetylmuramate dehydrogenase